MNTPTLKRVSRLWFLVAIMVLALLAIGAILTRNVNAQTSVLGSKDNLALNSCQDPQKRQDRHFAEMCYWRGLLADEHGNIPAGALANVYTQLQRTRSVKPGSPSGGTVTGLEPWTAIGPGNSGGRIRSIVVHPTDPNTIWVGSVGGGVFKTTDGGATWSTHTDSMANLAVSTLVISPTDPNTLYAGTGEGFSNFDALQGAGVFQTVDAGATWTQLASTVPDVNCNWCFVNRLAISPDGTTLLAAQNVHPGGLTAIWRSTNGGTSWTSPLVAGSGAGSGISQKNAVEFVAFDPNDSSKAVASGTNGAWYSTDGGATWNVAAFSPVVAADDRVELAYAPGSSNIVYASVDQNGGEVYQSTDGGQNYMRINTGHNLLGGQGWYDNAIWVNPDNPNFVAVGGTQFWISMDGGTSFTSAGYGVGMHPDNHAIVADPGFNNTSNKRVYVGNDGGIYTTADISTTIPTWTSLVTNLPITQFYSGVGHDTTGKISGGAQDNGTPGYTGGFNTWVDWTSGDGGHVATDNTDTSGNTWYGEYVYLQISRSTTGFTPFADGITSGGGAGCDALGDAVNQNALFIAPFVLDPNNPEQMLAGGDQLWLSTNVKTGSPVCWSSIKASVGGGALISAIAVKAGDSNTIWVGYTNGRVEMTTNGGGLWTPVGSGTLPARQVTRIAIGSQNSDNVIVTYGGFGGCCFTAGNVWRTPDAGTNWADISGGLPAIPVFAATFYPGNDNRVYIGTIAGVFDTQAALGATVVWSNNDGPANVAVTDLSWVGPTHKLLAATHGRSMWITQNLLSNKVYLPLILNN